MNTSNFKENTHFRSPIREAFVLIHFYRRTHMRPPHHNPRGEIYGLSVTDARQQTNVNHSLLHSCGLRGSAICRAYPLAF